MIKEEWYNDWTPNTQLMPVRYSLCQTSGRIFRGPTYNLLVSFRDISDVDRSFIPK